MTRPDDETLMAFADGALDAESRARVEAYLATDAEARRMVEQFRRSGDLARAAYDDVLKAPLPPALEALFAEKKATAGADGSSRGANVVELRPKPSAATRRLPTYVQALAASLVLAAGIGIGLQLGRGPAKPDVTVVAVGAVAPASDLAQALETRASYEPLPALVSGERRNFVIVSTFRDRAGRPCREFETATADADQRVLSIGVACRATGGGWTVEGLAQPVAATAQGNNGGMRPASGVQEGAALEGFMKMLGAGAALPRPEEQDLLAKGWK